MTQDRLVKPMTDPSTAPRNSLPLSALDLQVLLVLASADLYGYAIMKAVEEASGGVLSPEIGSLYRVLARLTDMGWVAESEGPQDDSETHRGKPRRYYRITERGREVARAEVKRLQEVIRDSHALDPEVAR
jgi:DNA-binding PadR family transcriptional regulator